jgi:(1->4)-alpha-D-glucan 1-alpha-D-glucosylmutase
MQPKRIPLATYRLQFNQQFTLQQATDYVSYFHALGISDLYASPLMKAVPGSMHGYDVIDCNQLNPALGTEHDLEQLSHTLHQKKMGLIVDTVPNHMSIAASANQWWQDVLENGPSSFYAHYFNIIWDPLKPELKNKVLLAVLGKHYGEVIENQELQVSYLDHAFFIVYYAMRFPLNPHTWPLILQPVIQDLQLYLDENDSYLLELQSIITALEHLPSRNKMEVEHWKERQQEKEVIKKRLATLLMQSLEVKHSLDRIVKQLNGTQGDPQSFDSLEALLKGQAYRLSYWRVTNDEINYRRFFDISTLVSMRVEEPDVFQAMHQLVLKYIQQGWITGLRIDHVDGLFDLENYFFELQNACKQATEQADPFYLLVEKILVGKEKLRTSWPVAGTSGYEYLNLVNGLFVVSSYQLPMQQIYERFTGQKQTMKEMIYQSKQLILTVSMSSELHLLARHLSQLAEQHRWSRDYTLDGLRCALKDVIAYFPVYRTYIRLEDVKVQEEDRHYIQQAIEDAKQHNLASDPSIFDFIAQVLLLQDPVGLTAKQILHRRQFVLRFQQLTGPVTAKGAEDTAFYRLYPLVSLNEVGMNPEAFGTSLELFHQTNQEQQAKWPHTLLATSTHDTKKSEDVRARLNVLSEKPEVWSEILNRWHALNQWAKIQLNGQEVPDRNEEYLLYQIVIGSWPLYPMDAAAQAHYMERIEKYMVKALKEAKVHTSWINPNEPYEQALKEFIRRILLVDENNPFIQDITSCIAPFIQAGLFNSLSQLLLKMTSPGVPDFYQGNELWEFTLVDPDNRQPIDYSNRQQLLSALKQKGETNPGELLKHLMQTPEDGRIKLYVTFQVLNFRQRMASLFTEGNYTPLYGKGPHAHHVIAFSRQLGEQQCVVITGRFYSQLKDLNKGPPVKESWLETVLELPFSLQGNYRDVLSGNLIRGQGEQQLKLDQLFIDLPLVILEKL